MDIFSQRKFLIRVVVLLTMLNVILIGAILWKDYFRKPPRRENPVEIPDVSSVLKKELHLTEIQVEKIRSLRSEYFEKERAISETIRQERDSINLSMFSNNADSYLIISLARRVAENEYRMELLRFEQAEKLKAICTPEQLDKFERLVLEIRDYFRNDKRPDNQSDTKRPRNNRPPKRPPR